MITINYYTGNWQSAINQRRLNPRSHVLIHDQPDARESDDFRRTLRSQGLDIGDFVKYFPRLKLSQYALTEYRRD